MRIQQPIWRLVDESQVGLQRTALESFATDDTYCHLVGQKQSAPVIRAWVHPPTVVLGIQDHRLPFVEQAIQTVEQAGYQTVIRNSGGLAVVLDRGIYNLSLILPEGEGKISIDEGYEQMLAFIRLVFPEIASSIEAYEIVGSYCPGSYDLSVAGKKFAGISQRRIRNGIAVQIYLAVEGSGSKRAQLIKNFYEVGQQQVVTKFTYPLILPEVMTSIEELYGQSFSVVEVMARVRQVVNELATTVQTHALTPSEMPLYQHYLQRMLTRNTKLRQEE